MSSKPLSTSPSDSSPVSPFQFHIILKHRTSSRQDNTTEYIFPDVLPVSFSFRVKETLLNRDVFLCGCKAKRDPTAERDQLQRERDHLQTGFNSLAAERDHLMKEIEKWNETNSGKHNTSLSLFCYLCK